jgi:hypothetical protein
MFISLLKFAINPGDEVAGDNQTHSTTTLDEYSSMLMTGTTGRVSAGGKLFAKS